MSCVRWYKFCQVNRGESMKNFVTLADPGGVQGVQTEICIVIVSLTEYIVMLFLNKISLHLLLKWQSLLQMPWLVVVWTIVTLCSEVCPVSISTNCKVFRTPLLVLLQIIESMLMLHPFYRNSTGCLLSIVVFSKPQHLCINFCIVVLLLTSNRSCLLVVVPIVLGIVTQIVNTLQFLLSIHQSLSQPNILAIVLPLMLLRSGMTSLKMFAVQHQLPPSERSLKLTCLQKPTHHSLSRHICVSLVRPGYVP